MQTPPAQPTVELGPWVINANAAYYLYGVPLGLLLSIPAYMVYERRFAPKTEQPPEEVGQQPMAESTPPPGDDGAAQKRKRKSGSSGLLYVMLAFIGADLIAQTAKMTFPGIPADAVVWGALTGLSAGFFMLAIVRHKARA